MISFNEFSSNIPGDSYSGVEAKQLMRFQIENSVFKFLRRSMCGSDLTCEAAFPPLVPSGEGGGELRGRGGWGLIVDIVAFFGRLSP